MKPTLIYAIKDATTHEVRYVGKTVSPYFRFKKHLSCKGQTHNERWLRSIGFNVEFIELEWVTEEWQSSESFWIAYFKSLGANLNNLTSGGEGMCDPPQEYRDAVSLRVRGNSYAKGYRHTKQALAKISATSKGRQPALGMVHSPEARRKISEAQKGKKVSEATLVKMKAAQQKLVDKKSVDMSRVWAERKANWVSKYDDKNIILDYCSGKVENKELLKKYGIGSTATLYVILRRNSIPLKGSA